MSIHRSSHHRTLSFLLTTHHKPIRLPNLHTKTIQSRLSTTAESSTPPARNPRWLSDQKSRLGKCITFGLQLHQVQEAGRLARILAEEWRGLVAGAEGFLVPTSPEGQEPETAWEEKVIWGSQDSMVLNFIGYALYVYGFVEWVRLMDGLSTGHVNNVNYVRYAESSRVWYFRRLAKHVPGQYRREWDDLPLQYPDRISVYHRFILPEVLQPSLILKVSILSHKHQRAAARVSEDVVIYDYKQGRKTDPPQWMGEVLRTAEAQERESGRYWLARRAEVENDLQRLEAESVFSGRKEDMGQSRD